MEGGGPISVLSLAFFSVSDEEDPQRNPRNKGARILRQASLGTRPFILGYIAK